MILSQAIVSKKAIPAPQTPEKPRKYRNEPVVIDGIRFDSKKEARRWAELQQLQRAGAIFNLQRQCLIPLIVNGVTVARYVADAMYIESGAVVVEDTKSPITRRHPVYRLKRRLLQATHGITIREV